MFSVPLTRRSTFFDDPFFQTSWPEFDRMRNVLYREPLDTWKRFEDMMPLGGYGGFGGALEGPLEQPLATMGASGMPSFFPRRWMMPSLATGEEFLRDLDIYKERDTEVIRVRDDPDKLEVTLDTSQYRPEELKVCISEGMICMEGKHEERSEDGSRHTTRHFIRR
jgi:Hsp20/alpha crystallin family